VSAPQGGQSRAEATLERFLADARGDATHHAIRRLLARRPDLEPPAPRLPVPVPPEEGAGFQLDALAVWAWFERQVERAVDAEVGTALQQGASWRLVAKALRAEEDEVRERYGHLGPQEGAQQ
jgi:hypothetical protein